MWTPCRKKRGEAFSKLRFPWKRGTNVETPGTRAPRAFFVPLGNGGPQGVCLELSGCKEGSVLSRAVGQTALTGSLYSGLYCSCSPQKSDTSRQRIEVKRLSRIDTRGGARQEL